MKKTKVDRRRLLKTIGAGTVAGSTMSGLVLAETDDWVEIDYRWGPESDYRRVPEDWYHRYQHVDRVHENNRYERKHSEVIGQSYHPGPFNGKKPKIYVKFREGTSRKKKDDVPDEKDGVKIEKGKGKPASPSWCDDNDGDGNPDYNIVSHSDDPMHGGVMIIAEDGEWDSDTVEDNSDYTNGTLAGRFLHTNKNKEFLGTAAHLFSDVCSTEDMEYLNIYGPDWEFWGSVPGDAGDIPRYLDFIPIDPSWDIDPMTVQHGQYNHYRVTYTFSMDGLAATISEGHNISKVGFRTCYTEGRPHTMRGRHLARVCPEDNEHREMKELVFWGSASCSNSTCHSGLTHCPGDSGSLCIAPNPYDNWSAVSMLFGVGYHISCSCCATMGTAMYHVADETGYYVGA